MCAWNGDFLMDLRNYMELQTTQSMQLDWIELDFLETYYS